MNDGDRMNDIDELISSARIAAGCAEGPEVRRMLRKCATQLEVYRDRDRRLAEGLQEAERIREGGPI